jgi:probable HAF family extracellular repeat protein
MLRPFPVPLVLLALLFGLRALAQGTYTQIDVPGSSDTYAFGINSLGEVTGYYGIAESSYSRGFVLSAGTFTTTSYGPNTSTLFRALNDKGKIVGNLTDGSPFVYDRKTGAFAILPCGISPTAINNSDVVVGTSGAEGVALLGVTCIYASPKGSTQTLPEGITARGMIVGFAQGKPPSNFVSFEYRDGQFTRVWLPLQNLHLTIYGVSSSGNAVVATSTNSSSSFLVGQRGIPQTLTFPGAEFTWATGVNDSGEVVGSFMDSQRTWHGFTWTPAASAREK